MLSSTQVVDCASCVREASKEYTSTGQRWSVAAHTWWNHLAHTAPLGCSHFWHHLLHLLRRRLLRFLRTAGSASALRRFRRRFRRRRLRRLRRVHDMLVQKAIERHELLGPPVRQIVRAQLHRHRTQASLLLLSPQQYPRPANESVPLVQLTWRIAKLMDAQQRSQIGFCLSEVHTLCRGRLVLCDLGRWLPIWVVVIRVQDASIESGAK